MEESNFQGFDKELTRSEVRYLGFSEFNPAYIIAILASLPGVTHSLKPSHTPAKIKIISNSQVF
jgi:hypothetical protein